MKIRTGSIVVVFALFACSSEKSKTSDIQQANAAELPASSTVTDAAAAKGDCDASLWKHVYNPTRLTKVSACLNVTGVIVESSADDDGDQHFLLRLDPGQDKLLNKRNTKKKGGTLVLEIVCANPIKLKKVKSACAGYTNRIPIPAVGAHVRATGTYVIDSHNGWAEIHPVSILQTI